MTNNEHFLIGKTLQDVKIADDKKAILFVCDDGNHITKADGDCCSYTWIEHVELPALGFPCKVLSVGALDLPEDGGDDDKVIKFYGLKLITDKGELVLDYRNSSNGHYGGNLCWPDDGCFDGGVFGQNVSSENWIAVS